MARKKKKDKKDSDEKKKISLDQRAKSAILAISCFAVALFSIVAFFNKAGTIGHYFVEGANWLLGGGKYLIPLFFIAGGLAIIKSVKKSVWTAILGISLMLVSSESLLGVSGRGGALGNSLGNFALKYLDFAGTLIVLLAIFLIALILSFNVHFAFPGSKKKKEKKEDERERDSEEAYQPALAFGRQERPSLLKRFSRTETKILHHPIFRLKKLEKEIPATEEKDPKPSFVAEKEGNYHLPPLDLLTAELSDKESVKKTEINNNIEIIRKTLENFDIPVTMGDVSIGPTVTQYTLKPAQGVKLSQIVALQNDLSLALAAHPLRIEAPIPGKSWVGIEVPNKSPHLVKLRNLLESSSYAKVKNYLTLPLGKNVAGESFYDNLARMPHLLIAGATGTGKSVAIHNLLISFLYQNSPRTLKLILVDPKRVELTAYNGIPHLLTPVITNAQKAINALKWAISEMDRRYEMLSQVQSRDILSYNAKVSKLSKAHAEEHKPLPYIVIVIDELADIMMTYGRETEAAVVRLAQMARAVGIHLILSTQRPSVEVITGLIKANITFRIAFQVASQIDSRTIIDMAGAEKLLGNGDMLYQTGDSSKPRRLQGAYISERELKKVVDFIKKQNYEEEEIAAGLQSLETDKEGIDHFKDYEFEDELYPEAKKTVIEAKKASATLLQTRLRIGYARAARLLNMLEQKGIIGPPRGSRPREVIVKESNDIFS